jgi:hypothetical protein
VARSIGAAHAAVDGAVDFHRRLPERAGARWRIACDDLGT